MANREMKITYGLFDNPLNQKLLAGLREHGEELFVFPPVVAEKLGPAERADDPLKNLTDFDWVIFTDVFAVDYFIELLRESAIDFFELDRLTVLALGETVADRLRFVQVHADVIPSKINDAEIFSAVAEFVDFELHDLRFLLVREQTEDFPVAKRLAGENSVIVELPVYAARFDDPAPTARFLTLLKGGAIDEFVFSMPEDLLALKKLAGDESLPDLLAETKISATTENAFQSLIEHGLRPLYFNKK